jgi:hypothetical protein
VGYSSFRELTSRAILNMRGISKSSDGMSLAMTVVEILQRCLPWLHQSRECIPIGASLHFQRLSLFAALQGSGMSFLLATAEISSNNDERPTSILVA